MESTKVVFTDNVHGEVQLFSDEIKAGKMNLTMTGGKLAVLHTEVSPEFEGRGFARLLLDQLVSYARENHVKIVPYCAYVNAQFRRRPAEYEDVWSKE